MKYEILFDDNGKEYRIGFSIASLQRLRVNEIEVTKIRTLIPLPPEKVNKDHIISWRLENKINH